MKIAAIVVTYNRKELLLECIEALLRQKTNAAMDIIIIDNNSTDGTAAAVEKYIRYNQIVYCNTGANLGGAGGFQYGMRYAAERGYTHAWVMDDDCIPRKTALQVFVNEDVRLHGKYGWLSSKAIWKDGSLCCMNVQRKNIWQKVKDFQSDTVPVVMASFVSLFIPTSVILEMGLPIKEFFIWTDDWEFTRRISREYPCFLCNKSVVIHKSNINIGANIATDTADRLGRYAFLYRNDVYLYRREGIRGLLYETVRLSWHILRVFLYAKNDKRERLSLICNGTIKGLSFRPRIEYIALYSDTKKEKGR